MGSHTQADLSLAGRLDQVRKRIEAACSRARRPASEVLLLAVTKVFPAALVTEAYAMGLRDFGENYVQEFEGKAPDLQSLVDARFHLIGHLQTNKAKKACELFNVIQTVESPKLARRLDDCSKPLDVMVEVKLSTEESKYGVDPAGLPPLLETLGACRNLRLTGLMTVPPWSENAEDSRPYFARLRELAEHFGLRQLSMGMSNDLEVAVEEGSTCVRVGTALFGYRQKA